MKCKKCGRQVLTWAKGQPLTWGCDQCREVVQPGRKPVIQRRRLPGAKCKRKGCKHPAKISVRGTPYRFCSQPCRQYYHAYQSPKARIRAQQKRHNHGLPA